MSSAEEYNPTSIRTVKEILATEGLSPNKKLGQNFIIDHNIISKIADTSGVTQQDTVLEIGTGLGALTFEMSKRAHRVITFEIDRGIIRSIKSYCDTTANVELHEFDFLKANLECINLPKDEPVIVTANVPYSITSPIIEKLLNHKTFFKNIHLLVQNEYADRLAAKPGSKTYGSITLFTSYHAEVTKNFMVSRNVFFPAPEVDSAFISLKPIQRNLPKETEVTLFRMTRAAFHARRKTLENSVYPAISSAITKERFLEALNIVGIDPKIRGEKLSLDQYIQLACELSKSI